MTLTAEESKKCKFLRETMEHNKKMAEQYDKLQLWFAGSTLVLLIVGALLIYGGWQTAGVVTGGVGILTGVGLVTFNRLAAAARTRRKEAYNDWDKAKCGDDPDERDSVIRMLV